MKTKSIIVIALAAMAEVSVITILKTSTILKIRFFIFLPPFQKLVEPKKHTRFACFT